MIRRMAVLVVWSGLVMAQSGCGSSGGGSTPDLKADQGAQDTGADSAADVPGSDAGDVGGDTLIPPDLAGDVGHDLIPDVGPKPDSADVEGPDSQSDTNPDLADLVEDLVDVADTADLEEVDEVDAALPDLRICIPGEEEACYEGPPGTEGVGICDGGIRVCKVDGLSWTACLEQVLPVAETCLAPGDEDCDGETNEEGEGCLCVPNEVTPCYTGPVGTEGVGTCLGGFRTCDPFGRSPGECVGEVIPALDVCGDGLDDDCNGVADDGWAQGAQLCVCTPGAVLPCYTGPLETLGVGICQKGQRTCDVDGAMWLECVGDVLPQPDTCQDVLDNDCDGAVNNGYPYTDCACLPGDSWSCYEGPQGTLDVGVCVAGIQFCDEFGTGYGGCEQQILPGIEVCGDGLDNDCSGGSDDLSPDGPCVCIPGTWVPCYSGPPATQGVGLCKAGLMACNALGTAYGACEGEVLPSPEICGETGVDRDCDGILGNIPDNDGDSWTICDGDCCELASQCMDPKGVNPGAFEILGDVADNDCDGVIDNALADCDTGLVSNSGTGTDYAKAMDLCAFTTENPPKSQKRWGVISASLTLADGTGIPAANSRSIRPSFGTNVVPLKGQRMAVLSTGAAAATGQLNPPFAAFQTGSDMGTASSVPADYLAANGGAIPVFSGCPAVTSTNAFDPVVLKLRIRVPTNAKSFSFRLFFFSSEYPEYVCTTFNDVFVALLQSSYVGSPANPTDKNIAKSAGKPPLSASYAGRTDLFRVCNSDTTAGCLGSSPLLNLCSLGTTQLAGTGFDTIVAEGCDTKATGGGTGWLNVRGNVTPGEVIELRLAIWDVGDHVWDSLVLLDSFQWNATTSQPGLSP